VATTGYVAGADGAVGPAAMPRSCVYAPAGERCVLVFHHQRERKTGPQIPVTVVQCRTHRRAFTLYPLGHVPYGRLAVAPVGLDGRVIFSTESEARGGAAQPAWERTATLGPAFTAMRGETVKVTDPRWWATRAPERLSAGARLLGVDPELPDADAEAIALRLEIPRLVHRQAAGEYATAHGRAQRGRVLVGLLPALGADACLLDRVFAAGARAGVWGTVTRWDAAQGGVRGQVFPGRGAAAG